LFKASVQSYALLLRTNIYININVNVILPVSLAERSKAGTVNDLLNIRIAGSKPAWGMDVCPRVSVLFCIVSVEALRRVLHPAKKSSQMSVYVDREAH